MDTSWIIQNMLNVLEHYDMDIAAMHIIDGCSNSAGILLDYLTPLLNEKFFHIYKVRINSENVWLYTDYGIFRIRFYDMYGSNELIISHKKGYRDSFSFILSCFPSNLYKIKQHFKYDWNFTLLNNSYPLAL